MSHLGEDLLQDLLHVSTSLAPSLMSRWVPRESCRLDWPRNREDRAPCSGGNRAVMREPLFSPASTTTTPREMR
jgi:hypothetical protein